MSFCCPGLFRLGHRVLVCFGLRLHIRHPDHDFPLLLGMGCMVAAVVGGMCWGSAPIVGLVLLPRCHHVFAFACWGCWRLGRYVVHRIVGVAAHGLWEVQLFVVEVA